MYYAARSFRGLAGRDASTLRGGIFENPARCGRLVMGVKRLDKATHQRIRQAPHLVPTLMVKGGTGSFVFLQDGRNLVCPSKQTPTTAKAAGLKSDPDLSNGGRPPPRERERSGAIHAP